MIELADSRDCAISLTPALAAGVSRWAYARYATHGTSWQKKDRDRGCSIPKVRANIDERESTFQMSDLFEPGVKAGKKKGMTLRFWDLVVSISQVQRQSRS